MNSHKNQFIRSKFNIFLFFQNLFQVSKVRIENFVQKIPHRLIQNSLDHKGFCSCCCYCCCWDFFPLKKKLTMNFFNNVLHSIEKWKFLNRDFAIQIHIIRKNKGKR